jgi:cell division protein FtsQ
MSRSLVAAPARRRAGARGSRRLAPVRSEPAFGIARRFDRAVSVARAGAAFVGQRRRLRVALLALLAALPMLGGGWLWLRQSPFVAVQRVQISGVHGPDAAVVEADLAQAARHMSTLDVSAGALRAVVAPLRVVSEVRAVSSFPHGLRIEVTEQLPVASLTAGGVRTAVAADGVVLGPALLSGSLPSVSGSVVTATGRRVGGASLLEELTVLGAAPALLAKHVERVFTGAKGLTVAMRGGLLVYFGDDAQPHAKWLSLASVLADQGSAGASYVDVRLPSHPAAGFPAGVSPPDAAAAGAAGSSEQAGSAESTVASLAAGLSGGGAATSSTATSATTPSEPTAGSTAGTSAPSEDTEAASGEAAANGEVPADGEATGSTTTPTPSG